MNRPWFPFYVGDYTRDTARLTTEAHGAYLLLILDYWVNGAPPDDDETLATITKLPVTIWRKRKASIRPFFKVRDGLWIHSRIEKERAKAEEVGSSNSDKARQAAERRWAKEREDKQRAAMEQCSDDAPSITGALPQNAQSQSQPPSKSKSGKEREGSLSKELNGGLEESGPIVIDESYQPGPRAIEYAYSLGMKQADLNGELSKFIARCMSKRAKSYSPDMDFKVWCDRWLEFRNKNNPPAAPAAAAGNGMAMVNKVLVIEGTLEERCWQQDTREKTGRPMPIIDVILENGRTARGWYKPTLFPLGYDEATGEKLPPKSDEAAA